ncbi:MAG: TatD family hydrolase [Actinomycetes bacterium]
MTDAGTQRPPLPAPLGHPAIDSHCHLDMRLDSEPEWTPAEALAAARSVGVSHIVQVGCDVQGSIWASEVAATHEGIAATVALHPNEAPRLVAKSGRSAFESAWEQIATLASGAHVRAIGETGLDYFRTGPEGRAVQEESFRRHIELARSLGKPVVVHDRDSHADVMRVLDEQRPETVVLHCFSGDAEFARECVSRGWYLSFAGPVTFKNSPALRDALLVTPVELLLVETDAPFLAPVPHRGRPNASYLIPETLRAMAAVRMVDPDALAAATFTNTQHVFGKF